METIIEKIVYPGESLSRGDGKIILVDEGLPGETLEIKVLSEKKNYIQAELLHVLRASKNRVSPRCDIIKYAPLTNT